jgi:hypothetical protein
MTDAIVEELEKNIKLDGLRRDEQRAGTKSDDDTIESIEGQDGGLF